VASGQLPVTSGGRPHSVTPSLRLYVSSSLRLFVSLPPPSLAPAKRTGPRCLKAPRSFPDSFESPGRLLELDGRALLFQGLLELLGFVLGEAFLDGLGSTFDQVLGFLEAQAGGGTDFLDNLDLLVAGGLEDDVEGRLFLSRFGCTSGRTASHDDRPAGCGLDAMLFLQVVRQL